MDRIKVSITQKTKQCPNCNRVKPVDQFIGRTGKIIKKCLTCRESGLCPHEKKPTECYICFGKQAIANVMYGHCRGDDKRDQRPIGNITRTDLMELLDTLTKCPICDVPFTYLGSHVDGVYQPDFVTIQRISNFGTHDKDNCTLWCFKCNSRDGNAHQYRDRSCDPIEFNVT